MGRKNGKKYIEPFKFNPIKALKDGRYEKGGGGKPYYIKYPLFKDVALALNLPALSAQYTRSSFGGENCIGYEDLESAFIEPKYIANKRGRQIVEERLRQRMEKNTLGKNLFKVSYCRRFIMNRKVNSLLKEYKNTKDITKVIDAIKIRPEIFIGTKSYTRLVFFLKGFEYNYNNLSESLFDGFEFFIKKYYKNECINCYKAILLYSGFDEYLDFISGKSCPINSELMRIFLQCHIVEQTGHGVPKIVEKYGANAYEFGTSMITVTIPFNKKHFADSQNVAQNVAQESSKINLELKIIELIKYNPKITRKDIATILDKSVKTIEREIKKSNKIYFIDSSKNGHWEIKE